MANNPPWTQEETDLLRIWCGKMPFAQIAASLGKTKNAAVGKAFRLGLCNKKAPADGK